MGVIVGEICAARKRILLEPLVAPSGGLSEKPLNRV